jgi:hypothetical protein
MNERTQGPEIVHTFEAYGGDALKRQDAFWAALKGKPAAEKPEKLNTPKRKGLADYKIDLGPYAFHIEAKFADEDNRLGFDRISPEQRKFLSDHISNSLLWVWFGRCHPRDAFLVPWKDWLEVEQNFKNAGLLGMAWQIPHLLEHRAYFHAKEALKLYRLAWRKEIHGWLIPVCHPFWTMPLSNSTQWPPKIVENQNKRPLELVRRQSSP